MFVFADSGGMYSVSEEMERIGDTLKTLHYHIEQLVFSTCEDWQGASERAFAEQLIELNGKFDILYSFIKAYSSLLKSYADDYDRMDADIAKKIKRI